MISALKRLDSKFLIMVGCLIGLPIFILLILAIMQGCANKKISHDKYEEKMLEAAEKYVSKENNELKEEGSTIIIKLSELVESGYIKSTEKLLDDTSCDGSVLVRRNGSSIETTNGGYLNYTVSLTCDDYKTTHLVDKIKEEIVTEGNGLYQIENSYIFKGDDVDNYIMFFDNLYRIMSIDENGILKLVKVYSETPSRVWDDKFNVDTNRYSGKNIYKDSNILTELNDDYENDKKISEKAKQHIVAYDACIGKRSALDYTISKEIDCSEKIEKQVVSMLNISDYAMASLDSDCVDLRSRSCGNYNYLKNILSATWTLNSINDNTYDVIYLSNGLMEVSNAKKSMRYNIVIYIDGNELYTEGKGTENNPYIIN